MGQWPASRRAEWDWQARKEDALWLAKHAVSDKHHAAFDVPQSEKFVASETGKVQVMLARRQQRRRTEHEQSIARLESLHAAQIANLVAQLENLFRASEEEKLKTQTEQLDELRQEFIADSKQTVPKVPCQPEKNVRATTSTISEPAVITKQEPKITSSSHALVSVERG